MIIIIKRVFFSFLSAFLAFRAIELLRILWASSPEELNALGTFIIAFLLNLFITGVIAIPGFVFSTHKLIRDSYFSIKNPSRLKQVYQFLKVELFRKALMIFSGGKRRIEPNILTGLALELRILFIKQSSQSLGI